MNTEVDPAVAHPAADRHDALAVLLTRSRERLASLGQEPTAGHFICPTCLRLLLEGMASRGHYPADALPGGSAQTELQCTDWNYLVSRYELMAINFFTREGDLDIGVPDLPGRVRAKGQVTSVDGKVRIDLTRFGGKAKRDFETLRARSKTPGRVTFKVTEPTPEAAVRPLLAWSFLAWYYYAGYLYVASPGASLVRRLIEALGEDLVAVYLHGSAVLGGFQWDSSDLDILALSQDPLSDRQFDRIVQGLAPRERVGLLESVEELVDAYWRDQLQRYRCDPETIESLRGLRRNGYRIGIATNGGARSRRRSSPRASTHWVDG